MLCQGQLSYLAVVYSQRHNAVCFAHGRFEPTTGSVDWQRIAAVNVAKVEREGDLQTLKQFLAEVAVGRVEADEIDANPGLVNAFSMAQLQVQYVLHCEQVKLAFCCVFRFLVLVEVLPSCFEDLSENCFGEL